MTDLKFLLLMVIIICVPLILLGAGVDKIAGNNDGWFGAGVQSFP